MSLLWLELSLRMVMRGTRRRVVRVVQVVPMASRRAVLEARRLTMVNQTAMMETTDLQVGIGGIVFLLGWSGRADCSR